MAFGHQAFAQSFSADDLAKRTIHRRAVEAVIWGVPAVNFDMMYQAMVRDAKAGPGSNKIVFWSRLFGWKNQTLTQNPDAIYFMPFFDTKDVGPVVLEIPASDEGTIVGSVDDVWQTAIEDVGSAGVDKGQGGKYLILPPDIRFPCLLAKFQCQHRPIRVTRCCAPYCKAAVTRTLRKRSHTRSG